MKRMLPQLYRRWIGNRAGWYRYDVADAARQNVGDLQLVEPGTRLVNGLATKQRKDR